MKFEDKRSAEQKKGQHGTCPTVMLASGAIINAHEYDEKLHGPIKKTNDAAPPATDEELKRAAGANVSGGPVEWAKKSVPELKDHLAGKGLSFDTNAKKDELVKLCEANP